MKDPIKELIQMGTVRAPNQVELFKLLYGYGPLVPEVQPLHLVQSSRGRDAGKVTSTNGLLPNGLRAEMI